MDLSWVDTDSDTKPWALNFAVDIQFFYEIVLNWKMIIFDYWMILLIFTAVVSRNVAVFLNNFYCKSSRTT